MEEASIFEANTKNLFLTEQETIEQPWKTFFQDPSIVVEFVGATITSPDLLGLESGCWLNDEVLNCYAEMCLQETKDLSTAVVSTQFWAKIVEGKTGTRSAKSMFLVNRIIYLLMCSDWK